MKKLLLIASIFCASICSAEQTKQVFNPHTGVPDFITALSTNSIAAGAGISISTNSSGVTITAIGSAASNLQTTQSGVQITSPTSSQNFFGSDFQLQGTGSTTTIALNPGTTDFIHNQSSPQSATVNIDSATVNSSFISKGTTQIYTPLKVNTDATGVVSSDIYFTQQGGNPAGYISQLWYGNSLPNTFSNPLVITGRYSFDSTSFTNSYLDPQHGFTVTAGTNTANIFSVDKPLGTHIISISTNSEVLLNGSAGTSGQAITSGGPGVAATWTTISGGSGSGIVSAGTFTWVNNFGIQVSTLSIAQTNTGAVNAVTVTSTGTGKVLQITPQGLVSGGYQNRSGAVTIGDDLPTRPFSTELVMIDSTTDNQAGGGLFELYEDNPNHNDPLMWIHNAGNLSNPYLRVDDQAPDSELVCTSTDNAHGLGKWEPASIAYQGVDLQVNSRSYDNAGFENAAYWHPLQKADSPPGLYLQTQSLTNDSGVLASSDTSAVSFITQNIHQVGLTGPLNTSASYWFSLPSTFNNQGQILYQSDNGRGNNFNARSWEFTSGGTQGNVLSYTGGLPVWVDAGTTSLKTQINATGVSTGTIQSFVTTLGVSTQTLAVSTGAMQVQLNTKVAYSSFSATSPITYNSATGAIGATQISLSTQVMSNLPTANLDSGTNADSSHFWRGDGHWISSSTFASGGPALASTQTWTGQNNWTTPAQSTFTYGLAVGSLTVSGGSGNMVITANPGDPSNDYQIVGSSTIPTGNHLAVWSSSWSLIDGGAIPSGGGGGGTTGLINTSSQYNVPYYSASGSSWTLSGASNFTNNGSTITVTFSTQTARNGFFDYQTSSMTVSSITASAYQGGGLATCGSSSQATSWTGGTFGCTTITAAGIGAITGNQSITLSGDATGAGTTAITVTNAALQPNITTVSSSFTVNGPLGIKSLYGNSAGSMTVNDLSVSLPVQTDTNKKLISLAVDLSGSQAAGTLAAARFPALTGDITTSAGAVATTLAPSIANAHTFTGAITNTSSTTFTGAVQVSTTILLSGSPGTSGQAILSGGNGAANTWGSPAAAPGGTPGQINWNSAGSFAGIPGSNVGTSSITLSTGGANGLMVYVSTLNVTSSMTVTAVSTLTLTNVMLGMPPMTAPAAPYLNGITWQDSTQGAMTAVVNNTTQTLVGTIYSMYNSSSVFVAVGTATVLSPANGIGTLQLPPNFFTIGKTLEVVVVGTYTTTGTPTLVSSFTLTSVGGSTTPVVASTTPYTLATVATPAVWRLEISIVCRTTGATGNLSGSGLMSMGSGSGNQANNRIVGLNPPSTGTTIDTTKAQLINLQMIWGTSSASNNITANSAYIRVLN